MIGKRLPLFLSFLFYLVLAPAAGFTQTIKISNDQQGKKITFGNEKIRLVLGEKPSKLTEPAKFKFLAATMSNSGIAA